MERHPVAVLATVLVLVVLILLAPGSKPVPALQLRETMTEAEFGRCGLHKLSEGELEALELWIGRRLGEAPARLSRYEPAETLIPSPSPTSSKSDLVIFNQQSKKYHCPSCEWARKCTRNCVEITRAEAIRRGGVACRTCGGKCSDG